MKLFAVIVFMTALSLYADTCVLVKDGKPEAKIIISENCLRSVKVAAKELQVYLQKISGAKLEIRKIKDKPRISLEDALKSSPMIILGNNAYSKALGISGENLKSGGYRIATRDKALVIVGHDTGNAALGAGSFRVNISAGTLYGTYDFLRGIGVRWYYPGELGEVVPKKQTVVVKELNKQDAPYFRWRKGIRVRGYREGGDGLWQWRIGMGGDLNSNNCHPFNSWPFKLRDSHPEYFAESGGKKNFNTPCFSNLEGRKEMIRCARNFYLANPYTRSTIPWFIVLHNDGSIRSCECAACKKKLMNSEGWSGSDTNLIVETTIDIAKAVEKEFPEAVILAGAYNKSIRPPTNVKKLPSNVGVILCKHGRLHQWSANYRKNSKYIMDGWAALGPKQMLFWEYYGHGSGQFIVAPNFVSDDIKYMKKIREEKKIDVLGELVFTDSPGDIALSKRLPWFGLNFYVTAKCLWNPDVDVDKLMNEYYHKFYGPAAGPVKKFFTLAEKVWQRPDHGIKWEYGDKNVDAQLEKRRWSPKVTMLADYPLTVIFKRQDIQDLTSYLNEAAKKTDSKTVYGRRVAWLADSFNYTKSIWGKQITLSVKKKGGGNVLDIPLVNQDLALNGVIDEKWKKNSAEILFSKNEDGKFLSNGTIANLLYSKDKLYISFFCRREPGTPLSARKRERDGAVWNDESVELFISTDAKHPERYNHIIVNSSGAVYDVDSKGRKNWDSKIKTARSTRDDSWQITMAIPFSAFGKAPKKGDTWAIGLYRNRSSVSGMEHQAAFPSYSGSYHSYKSFGKIIFSGKADIKQGLAAYWPLRKNSDKVKLAGDAKMSAKGGVLFNGQKSYVDCGSFNKLPGIKNTREVSVGAWFKIGKPLKGNRILVSCKRRWNDSHGFYIGIRPSGNSIEVAGSGGKILSANSVRFRGGWNHLACVIKSEGKYASVRIFLNGKIQRSGTIGPLKINSNHLYFGCCAPGKNSFDGLIGPVRIYNRTLSRFEIKKLYDKKVDGVK